MVAYNFQKQFVEPIRNREKTHTIRRWGKRSHARLNDPIQLYTGMRTKSCTKIVSEDPICLAVLSVRIDVKPDGIKSIRVGGIAVEDMEAFAREDGFDSLADMHAFWVKFNGIGLFRGALIEWGWK
jgi:hypothetical protein